MNGYAGKILSINLTTRQILTIPTIKYEQWVGGHGMGSALFFDMVKDKTIDGFDPENLITLMSSPLCGTLVPSGAGRTEVQGIGVQSLPIGWFTRSNFGGRFSAMLKYAGWDGIAVQGQADSRVWLDIRNRDVRIRECRDLELWGTDTWECQKRIWKQIAGSGVYGDWIKINEKGSMTTQRPAVVAIGPAGENLSRMACLIHDAGNGAGQGGFGAVFGKKGLKAISVIGTGSVHVNDPKALMKSRLWMKKNYSFDLKNIKINTFTMGFQSPPVPMALYRFGRPLVGQRPQACTGCTTGCRGRYEDGIGNEAICFNSIFYYLGKTKLIQRQAADLVNQYGLNAAEMFVGELYLKTLRDMGVVGKGKQVDCPLNFEEYGELSFAQQLVKAISYRNDGMGNPHPFGDTLAEGFVRAAQKWGRLSGKKSDLKTGLLKFPHWGLPKHKLERSQLDWGFGTMLGDRDINEHCFDMLRALPTYFKRTGKRLPPAEGLVTAITGKMKPFSGDIKMLDFSTENMYSDHIVKLVTWHRWYTRFWKQSAQLCDFKWPDFLNLYGPKKLGAAGIAEQRFFNDVTGKNFTFLDGINLGKKIWNLDNAIWILQGRHRDMVRFADYIYTTPGTTTSGYPQYMPGTKNGKWDYVKTSDRHFNDEKFEDFKTRFYQFQGWDPQTGCPTKKTLAALGLDHVAKELEENGKI